MKEIQARDVAKVLNLMWKFFISNFMMRLVIKYFSFEVIRQVCLIYKPTSYKRTLKKHFVCR
jgi:hypothetical protein